MNKIVIIGRLTRDPELKSTNAGTSVCNFSVAVDRTYRDKEGNRPTDFSTFPFSVQPLSSWPSISRRAALSLFPALWSPASLWTRTATTALLGRFMPMR